jgi:hypothetical protein
VTSLSCLGIRPVDARVGRRIDACPLRLAFLDHLIWGSYASSRGEGSPVTAPGADPRPAGAWRPFDVELRGRNLSFRAPGDDLLCRKASRYELRQSDEPITGESFADAEPLAAPDPQRPGTSQSLKLPPDRERFVAIRAVDEQGNVGPGPPASVDLRGCRRDEERSRSARRPCDE